MRTRIYWGSKNPSLSPSAFSSSLPLLLSLYETCWITPININTTGWVNSAWWSCSHLTSTWPNTIDSTGTWKKEKCAESLFKSPAISLSLTLPLTSQGLQLSQPLYSAYSAHWWARSSGDQAEIRDTEFKTDGKNEKRRTEIDWDRGGRG